MEIGLQGIEWNNKKVDKTVKEFAETLNSNDDISFFLRIPSKLANNWIINFNFRNAHLIELDIKSKVFGSNNMICAFGKVK